MKNTELRKALSHVILAGFIGRPGCGKEFTGNHLLLHYTGYTRIVMSELIGRFCQSGTSEGARIKQILDSGELVPDSDVVELFLGEVSHLYKEGARFVICDGFPRNLHQLEILLDLKAKFLMLHIDLDEDLAVKRMLERKRPGEDRHKCVLRQQVFERNTLPMIQGFTKSHPENYRLIDGSQEKDIRARLVHNEVTHFHSRVSQHS